MANLISVVRGLLYLCRKEFLAIVKDPANRVILIAPAIVQTLLFGYGATYDLNYVPYAVLDQSNGTASRELLARFDSTGVFQRVGRPCGGWKILPGSSMAAMPSSCCTWAPISRSAWPGSEAATCN